MAELDLLLKDYRKSPEIFQAGRYWKNYEDKIVREIKSANLEELRSNKYPIFATFGFTETVHYNHPEQSFVKKVVLKFLQKLNNPKIPYMPYSLYLKDIREMAYNHCLLQGEIAGVKSIAELETSSFGKPDDFFEIKGKKYTMAFLTYYIRLCYVQKNLNLVGNETIVELGSGSGHQVELLKKVFPNLTILCFDLPYNLFLCNVYLNKVLGSDNVVDAIEGIKKEDLHSIQKGKVNMFGNWQFPLLTNFKFDLFWNAASFGEMEPHIVKNYLSYVVGNCNAVYLLQARQGKESSSKGGVETPIFFEDYCGLLSKYTLLCKDEPLQAHRILSEGVGYFHAIWKK